MRGMFRFPSWISESRGEDIAHGVEDIMAEAKPESFQPLVLQAVDGVAKRKRDNTKDISSAQADTVKRRKASHAGVYLSASRPEETEAQTLPDVDMDMPDLPLSVVRDTSVSQVGLEILMRHKELRLINQNLAKAQVALEQLRRCHLIPFPVNQGSLEAKLNISAGTGPAVVTRQGSIQPQWAPPYGVANGPYSRHYAKWLIPDPSFDGEQPVWEWEKTRIGRTSAEGRATRNSNDMLTPGAKARAQRGSMIGKLHALPSGYTPSKENAGPSILKRPDGQLVKLVCLDCHRENFGSTQGFINHCRIAHKREFKSHEEAAIQSGVAIELDDVGGIVGEEKPAPVATGLVHPLISRASTDRATYAAVLLRINQSMNMFNQGKLPGVTSIPGAKPASAPANTNFVPSLQAPNLSKFLQAKGFNGNLDSEVNEAKKKIELDESSSEDESTEDNVENTPTAKSAGTPVPAMRMPARAVMSAAPFGRPGSSKGPEGNGGRKSAAHKSPYMPYAAPINTTTAINNSRPTSRVSGGHEDHSDEEEEHDSDSPILDTPSIHDMSPNTINSNNAPSLVSDDEDYDEVDDAESSIDDSDEEEEGSDVAEIIEDAEGEDKVLPSTALRRGALRKEEKHVTFVSPVKERRTKSRAT